MKGTKDSSDLLSSDSPNTTDELLNSTADYNWTSDDNPSTDGSNASWYSSLRDNLISTQSEDDEDDTSSKHSTISNLSCTSQLAGSLPKSFLQLKGISVAIYNMGCNFSNVATIQFLIQYEIAILAIQEHTPWNRTLSATEISSMNIHAINGALL
jgi:hypothetical protein